MAVNHLEDIYTRFCEVDSDDSGVIEKEEFELLILKILGAKDHADVPQGRLCYFWNQADRDGNGEIDFDEFLIWFRKYFSKRSADTIGNAASSLVENFYSTLTCNRKFVAHEARDDFHTMEHLITRKGLAEDLAFSPTRKLRHTVKVQFENVYSSG